MKRARLYSTIFLGLLSSMSTGIAQEINVATLSNGSCWYEQKDEIKIVSFNDKEALHTSRDNIELQFRSLVGMDETEKLLTKTLSLHCGGYGASLVVKTTIHGRPACAWLKVEKGELKIRSLGGTEESKSNFCDGYKWGELLVSLKDKKDAHDFLGQEFSGMITKVDHVSGNLFKVTLAENYHGKEQEVMNRLDDNSKIKYIELNRFQHPVGDYTQIK